ILKVENWDGVNRLRVAMTKKDGFNTSGYGKIGDFYIVIEGNVPTDVSNEPIMRIEDVYIVDELLNIKQWVEGELKVDILSATEELSKSKLRIYPNPSSTGTVVVEGLPSNEIDSIEFYDALGRGIPISIKEKEIKFQGDFTGVAFLRVNTKEGFITQRIIITR
ncbi:MAG: T9SS type A sorting domain-containing protein, partial [Saprospiraceae bacterium]